MFVSPFAFLPVLAFQWRAFCEEKQEKNLTAEFIQKERGAQKKLPKEPNSTNCLICLFHHDDGLPISLE